MGKKRRDGRASGQGKKYTSSNAGARNSRTTTGIRYGNGTYEGELKDGKPHGEGTMEFDGGDVYEGDFVEGRENGKGTFKWKAGEVYVGEWKDGKQHGWGMIKWTDGDEYEGEFQDDKIHGRGGYRWFDGRVYEGEWVEEKQHGWGTMKYPSGRVHEWPSGGVYEGEWVAGKQHGRGTMTSPSGKVHEGQWAEGEPHGRGTAKFPTGEIFEGIWMEGEFVKRKLRSQRSQQRRLEAATNKCEHCGVDDYQYKLRVCSGCNLALYCSAACQKAARRSHQRICDIASMLPSRDSDRLALACNKMVDLDAGLRYATKYMDRLKHLSIDVNAIAGGDALKLSTKQLSSLFRSKKGALDFVSCVCTVSGNFHAPGITQIGCDSVWKELHGLKQLRLYNMNFDEVQCLNDVIYQQKDTLTGLTLPYLRLDWSKAKTRRTIAQAVNSCKNLVKLRLPGCVLMDSDLKVMLHYLPNLRILSLSRATEHNHEFTDNTCGLIARKCPGLQLINLTNHNQLSVKGLRKIFEGCINLRSFSMSTRKLSGNDIQTLLDSAPQLLHLCLDVGMHISEDELSRIIEATGGRTVIQWSDDEIFEPRSISVETREMYEHQKRVLFDVKIRQADPEVANEWEDMFEG